jgi:hypothetical protein
MNGSREKWVRQLRTFEERDGDGSSHADSRAKDLSRATYFSDVHSFLPVDEFHARIEALALVNVANIFSGLEKYRQGN